jgi:dihydrofolate reductase
MRKIILEEWLSLDGFVADKNDQLDFFTALGKEANKYSDEEQLKFMDGIDTILLGRKTYELFYQFWPTATTDMEVIADRLNETKKIVFSNSIKKAPWGKWPDAEIANGSATDQVRKLKMQNGKDIVLWGSISLAQSLIKENLIDEYHIQLCPTVVGGGRPLFANDIYIKLDLFETRRYETGVVFLKYRPKK